MNELAVRNQEMELTQDKIELIKRTIAKGASNDELELFIHQCNRTQLDPFAKQIYCIGRYDSKVKATVYQTQLAIDGLRLVAHRTGEYLGQTPAYWCGTDGVWVDVWLKKDNPAAAKIGVYREGSPEPIWAVANWDAYVQTYKGTDGQPHLQGFWAKGGPHQLAKCAEALALRKAFPMELSGLYIEEELDAAFGPPVEEPKTRKTTQKAVTETTTRKPPQLKAVETTEPEIIDAEIVESEAATAEIPQEVKPQPWHTALHIKADKVGKALEMDGELICDAAVLKVTGRGTSTKDVKDRTEANAVVREFDKLMAKTAFLQSHFEGDREYYTIEGE